ncbi:MAG TPA: hypothetical protein VGD59_11355 [Acidisarcina sp.]
MLSGVKLPLSGDAWQQRDWQRVEDGMQDLVNTLMLICAAVAALGLGVVLAYAACMTAFAVLRMHSQPPARVSGKAQVAQIL